MRRMIYSTLLMLVFFGLGHGQTNGAKPRLLGSFGANSEDLLELLDNVGMAAKADFNLKGDAFAVRVCSNEPLPIALAMSKGAPFLTTLYLQEIGIPESSIYYLRQNKSCGALTNHYAATEYWLIPKDAEFPEFVESRRAAHLSGYEVTHAGSLANQDPSKARSYNNEKLTPKSYGVALERTVRPLKADRSAVAVILVPYHRFSRTPELNRRVADTLKYLKGHRIANHRIFVKRVYSGMRIGSPAHELKYPDITVVREK